MSPVGPGVPMTRQNEEFQGSSLATKVGFKELLSTNGFLGSYSEIDQGLGTLGPGLQRALEHKWLPRTGHDGTLGPGLPLWPLQG